MGKLASTRRDPYFPFISTLFSSILFGKGAHEHSSEFSITEVGLTFRNHSADVKSWNVKSLSAYLKHRNDFHEFKKILDRMNLLNMYALKKEQ